MHTDLIKRLQAATAPSRDLDAEIYVALLGGRPVPRGFSSAENYTNSIDACINLFNKVHPCRGRMTAYGNKDGDVIYAFAVTSKLFYGDDEDIETVGEGEHQLEPFAWLIGILEAHGVAA